MTALHLATAAANYSIIKKLLNKGIDIDLKNKQGKTAYQMALELNNKSLINILKKNNIC